MPDRLTVNIEGLRELIKGAHKDNPLWSELSINQRIRRLLKERLAELYPEQAKELLESDEDQAQP